jgi:hypothetical protein
MPDFYAQTYKTHVAGKWSNVYRFSADNLAVAVSEVLPILEPFERSLLHPQVSLKAIRFSTVTAHDDVFEIIPLNEAGTSSDAGDLIPFFNCVRVDISVIGGGRPSRKYYKGLLTETLITGMNINSGTVDFVSDAVNDFIAAMNDAGHAVKDNDGQAWDVASAFTAIQMRQMHRKRRRRVTPS